MSFNRLGKGLSGLISDAAIFANQENERGIFSVPIKHVFFNPNQPRKFIDEEKLEELSTSISKYGLLQPILVKKIDEKNYQIIAGERRYHASKKAGLTEIPVILKDVNDMESFEIAIIENIQRQDLNVIEEYDSYKKLIEDFGYTQDEVAEKVFKSRAYIANAIRVMKLHPDIIEMISNDKISVGHAKLLINIDNPLQLVKLIVKEKLSVRKTEDFIKKYIHKDDKIDNVKTHNNEIDYTKENDAEDLLQTEKSLSKILDANVKINTAGDKSYKIVIKCEDIEKLDDIIQKLSSGLTSF